MKRLIVVTAAILLSACSSMPAWMPGSGWTTLIDGEKGMENFNRTGDGNWRAEGGAIVADKASGNSYLVTKKSYKDFQILAEFWTEKNTNSGVWIRLSDPKNITTKNSYEVNIYDDRPDPKYATGAIVDVAPISSVPRTAGKWNTFEITAKGDQLTVVLNGQKTVEVRNSISAQGPFGLQFGNHGKLPGGPIKFRKVQVREL
jgi:hypothetical protein